MLDCLVMGDSIAVGTHEFKKECAVIAKGGINSYQWVNNNIDKAPFEAKTVIISLGSNDHSGVNSFQELLAMRQKVEAERVFWIMPAIKPEKQKIVENIAKHFGDTLVAIPELSKDGIHPTYRGYRQLGELTK